MKHVKNNPKQKILVLGGSYLQSSLIETSVELGYETYFIDRNANCYSRKIRGAQFVHIDVSDYNKLVRFCSKVQPEAVISPAMEYGNYIAAKLSLEFPINYNHPDVVKKTLNKQILNSELQNTVSFSVPWQKQLYSLNRYGELDFPLVVKPSASSAGRGVKLVNNVAELELAVEEAKKYCDSEGDIFLEAYIKGDQYSIETISCNGKHYITGITKEFFTEDSFFIEHCHTTGPYLFDRYIETFRNVVQELLNHLEIKTGPCHSEFVINDNGIYLIECASRSGGWRDKLLQYAKGSNYNKLIIQSYLNDEIDTSMIQKPKQNALAFILLYESDIEKYRIAREKGVLKEHYFNGVSFVRNPENLMDAFGYFFASSAERLDFLCL